MKKKILSLALVLSLAAILAGGTFAYVSVNEVATNVITTDGVSIHLNEKTTAKLDENGNPTDYADFDLGLLMPSVEVSKIVTVTNEAGSANAYIRVKVEREIIKADGTAGDAQLLEIDFNTTDWTYSDGWYYCNQVVKGGKTTPRLFSTVTFAPEMGNDYQNSTAAVYVKAQAVQSANNGSDPMTAKGWPRS